MERERDENLTGAGTYFILSLTSYPRAVPVSCNRRAPLPSTCDPRGKRPFAAWWVCIFTVVAASSLILLVFRELRFPEPILDLSILKIPLFDVSVSLILVMIFVVYALSLLNPLFFQELLGYSPWKSGIAVLPRGFGSVIGMLLVIGISLVSNLLNSREQTHQAYLNEHCTASCACDISLRGFDSQAPGMKIKALLLSRKGSPS
jgi:hypothetical protein